MADNSTQDSSNYDFDLSAKIPGTSSEVQFLFRSGGREVDVNPGADAFSSFSTQNQVSMLDDQLSTVSRIIDFSKTGVQFRGQQFRPIPGTVY